MKTALLSIILALASVAGAQTTITNGAGLCSTPGTPPNQTLSCYSMPTSDGGLFSFNFRGQPSETFTNGTVYKYGPGGVFEWSYADFSGTYVGGVITGTFNAGTGSTTQIIHLVRGNCYRGTCGKRPAVLSGSITF